MTRVFEEHLLDDVVRSSLGFDLVASRSAQETLSGRGSGGGKKKRVRSRRISRASWYIYIYISCDPLVRENPTSRDPGRWK